MFVFLAGTVARGSKRWIDLGFFRFQPSEFGKLLVVLALAGFLADRYRRVGRVRGRWLTAVALALPPMLLVFIQPDIGSALVYAAALVARAVRRRRPLVAPRRLRRIVAVVLALSVLWWLPAAGMPVLKGYQTSRLTGFLHPDQDPRGSTYNVTQSITAVGSGGSDRPRRRRAPRRRASSSCPSTRPTSRSRRSPSSAASSAPGSC